MKSILLLCCSVLLLFSACKSSSNFKQLEGPQKTEDFGSYWYQSKAEINAYKLEQARYGEIHEGSATLIFVTEPFNTLKQVKADNGMAENTVSVLKCNQIRKFNTGIYPYSTMTSSFTPVDVSAPSASLKITNSVQEWCGQAFMQINKESENYKIQANSYFETEGDRNITIPSSFLEDEIFNLIRINPAGLPTGNISIFPSSTFLRFMHRDLENYKAIATKKTANFNSKELQSYSINYPELGREFTVYFEANFPFKIEGWEEKSKGFRGNSLTTKATLQNQILSDYWNRNAVSDSTLHNNLFDF